MSEPARARPALVVALDVRDARDAVRLASVVAPHAAGFQVGLGLLHGPGPGVVGAVARIGPVLADAALHGIPSAVAAAARRLGEYGARWVTVHAAGGRAMVEAAVEGLAAGARGGPAGVLAITVLTSLDGAELARTGIGSSPGKLAARLARVAEAAGAEGVVCPVPQLGVVAEVVPRLLKVTPGIREGEIAGDDQRATAGIEEALRRGADLVVVGRPVVGAPDPAAAVAMLADAAAAG